MNYVVNLFIVYVHVSVSPSSFVYWHSCLPLSACTMNLCFFIKN